MRQHHGGMGVLLMVNGLPYMMAYIPGFYGPMGFISFQLKAFTDISVQKMSDDMDRMAKSMKGNDVYVEVSTFRHGGNPDSYHPFRTMGISRSRKPSKPSSYGSVAP